MSSAKVSLLILAALVVVAPGVAAQEAPAGLDEPGRIVAAGWCAVTGVGSDRAAEAVGCDVGVAASLLGQHRLRLVAGVGTDTVGAGLGWVATVTERGVVVSVAVGVAAHYDIEHGVIVRDIAPILGATFGLGGK